jgi:hypothetical protein
VDTGSNNLAIGASAGTTLTSGGQNIYIGAGANASASGATNEIAIGYNATGLGNNSAVLGNSNIATTILRGNVGIGTTTPAATLDVSGSVKCNSIISSRFKLHDIEYRMVSWGSGFSSNQFTTSGGSIIFFFSYSRYSEAISSKTDTIQLRQAGTNTVIATYTYIFYFNSANFHVPASFSRIYLSLTAGTYYFYCSTNATTNADVNVMNISAIEFPF